jgi:hypothetical protein
MLYQPDFIVYLWIVPVFLLVVLPLFWAIFCSLYRGYERSRLAEIEGFVEIDQRAAQGEEGAEQRQNQRVKFDCGKAFVDEDETCCKAFVANISERGVCLKNIPRKMYMKSNSFRVVLRTQKKDYSLTAIPKWKKMIGNGYMVGAELIQVPEGWRELNGTFTSSQLAQAV